jgi:hypothetical protein
LVKALGDILKICRRELASEVEMEFAADLIPESGGNRIVLKLLQVRPIREFMNEDSNVYGNVASDIRNVLIRSDKALGAGYINNIDNFVLISPDKFDNAETVAIAEEIGKINSDMRSRGEGYILIGPGRWGSSDRFLGIPVTWSDISEAKVIIENSLPGYEVEPSQGTHFFQNITSLGIGYLSVSRQAGNGFVDFDSLYSLETVQEGRFTKVLKAPSSLVAFIDRNTNQAIIGY